MDTKAPEKKPVELTATIATPLDEISNLLFLEKKHAVIGISPFNGYFTYENIVKLLSWTKTNFAAFDIFVPDKVSALTLQAMGYAEDRAAQKTRKQDSYLKNKILKALCELGYSTSEAENKIITLTKLLSQSSYQIIHHHCVEQFKSNEFYRTLCLSAVEWVIGARSDSTMISEKKLLKAVDYFLYEMPLFLDTPSILKIPTSIFIYHAPPKCLEYMYKNRGSINLVAINQGFLKLQIA